MRYAITGIVVGAIVALLLMSHAVSHSMPLAGCGLPHKPYSALKLEQKAKLARCNVSHSRGAISWVKEHRSAYDTRELAAVARNVLRDHRRTLRRALANLAAIRAVREAQSLRWQLVGATSYGPSIDPGMGTTGACYDLRAHPWSYAEMQGGSGLGGLPCGYRFVVKNPANGRVAVLEKGDTGCGLGPDCYGSVGGYGPDRIDLWETAHYYLGFSGYGPLLIAPAPRGWGVGPR